MLIGSCKLLTICKSPSPDPNAQHVPPIPLRDKGCVDSAQFPLSRSGVGVGRGGGGREGGQSKLQTHDFPML